MCTRRIWTCPDAFLALRLLWALCFVAVCVPRSHHRARSASQQVSYVTAAGECEDVIDVLNDNAAAGPGTSLLAIAAAAVAMLAIVA